MLGKLVPLQSARIGVIGLGQVGAALAKNISAAGYTLSVYDKDPARMGQCGLPATVQRAQDSAQLTLHSDVVVTALPVPAVVKHVIDTQVLPNIAPGSVWIDHSTTDYEQTIRFADIMERECGAHALEAPVTGGIELLRQGKMTTLVGGDKALFAHCKPLLAASCAHVLYTGAMGTATITKVISNMLAGAHLVVAGEALLLAKRGNVDLHAFFDAIRLSAGNSFVFETEAPLMFKGTYQPDFDIALHCKDFALGQQLAKRFKTPIPVHSLVEQIYDTARYTYGDDAGSSHPARLIPDALRDSLETDGFAHWSYSIQSVPGGSVGVIQKNIEQKKMQNEED